MVQCFLFPPTFLKDLLALAAIDLWPCPAFTGGLAASSDTLSGGGLSLGVTPYLCLRRYGAFTKPLGLLVRLDRKTPDTVYRQPRRL